jgi:hypothetical protein
MRLHATRNNLAPSALDSEPSTCALDSSRSLPFIAPLRLRWSPVVLQWKTSSISFPFLLLRDSFFHNDRGTPTPLHFFPISPLASPGQACAARRSQGVTPRSFTPSAVTEGPLSLSIATHPEIALVSTLVATLPKTRVLKVLCLPHFQKMTGVGGSAPMRMIEKRPADQQQ